MTYMRAFSYMSNYGFEVYTNKCIHLLVVNKTCKDIILHNTLFFTLNYPAVTKRDLHPRLYSLYC